MDDAVCRMLSNMVIISISALVLYHSCLRASSIYFFELDSTFVYFMTKRDAIVMPIVLSVLLYFVYLGTKKHTALLEERKQFIEREKTFRSSRSSSFAGSRKVSVSERPFTYPDEQMAEQASRLKRLLSAIEEQDTIHAAEEEKRAKLSDIFGTSSSNEEVVKNDESSAPPKVIVPEEHIKPLRRRVSISDSKEPLFEVSPEKIPEEVPEEVEENIYEQLANADLLTYALSAINIFPSGEDGPMFIRRMNLIEILSDLLAIHVPIWGCVYCLFIIMTEQLQINASSVTYHYESSITLIASVLSIIFGLLHEYRGNWFTNDVLALSSIFVVCSRIQAVSYQSVVIFVIGMSLFDLFFLYVVDLLSTVTRESQAPLMILFPRNFSGDKQSLATLDIMVPGIFLNVVLKYGSMYDPGLFDYSFITVYLSLVLTMAIAVWRHKITPAMVLPAIAAIGSSLVFSTIPQELWRFMIRH